MSPAKRTQSGTFLTQAGLTQEEMTNTLDELQRENLRLRNQVTSGYNTQNVWKYGMFSAKCLATMCQLNTDFSGTR